MATRARSGRHWAHCPRLRDHELALGAIGLTAHGYETTVSAMATGARSGRHWAHCPRLRDHSERYGFGLTTMNKKARLGSARSRGQ
ncbi:Hypothetical predicted protein [Octopus vulgaris]|uniref:Uncharacterized protein n=1 Tax=Octopus vulgaris TaxID=6645 RepID=A0AA36FAJ1_OCTVU|nr:Hypothetical predicted protein [Octopus vulgaris]